MKKLTLVFLALSLAFVFCSCNIHINNIELTEYKETIKVGEKFRIKYSVNFEDESVLFVSSNTKVATVDLTGVVQGVGVGDTTITVKLSSNKDISTSFTLNVTSRYNKEDFANIPLDEDLWHIKYLEEGADVETLRRIVKSMADTANEAGVKVPSVNEPGVIPVTAELLVAEVIINVSASAPVPTSAKIPS